MLEVCRLDLIGDAYQLVQTGDNYPDDDFEDELIEMQRLEEISESDLPKPFQRPADLDIRLFRAKGEDEKYLAICKGYRQGA